jgi:NAD-dependent SIR2 family protein deacetylase
VGDLIAEAAAAIAGADALIVSAGAGMGVDSGLPDFRGNEGFWRAYPPMKKLGLSFAQMANPRWFSEDPALAWGFYGHRLALYRMTPPHAGYAILRRLGEAAKDGYFVFTSNVDGAFQRAGFDPLRIVECHGAIEYLQCMHGCGVGIHDAGSYQPVIDEATFRAHDPLPACQGCGAQARPNVLMFGDYGWDSARTDAQEARFEGFLRELRGRGSKIVVVECGAGSAVPTVRMTSERLARGLGAKLIRINLREPDVPAGQLGLASGALDALTRIEAFHPPSGR